MRRGVAGAVRVAGAALATAAVLLASACGSEPEVRTSTSDTTPKPYPSAGAALASARAAWAKAGIRDYDLTVEHACLCTANATVRTEIRGGSAVRTVVVKAAVPNLPTPSVLPFPATVEAFFDVIENGQAGYDRVDVTYDRTTGAPTRVLLDPVANASDDESDFTITLTRPLAGGTATPIRDLTAARAAWSAAGIADYTLVVTRSCFCTTAGTVTVVVRGGRAVSTTASPPPGGASPRVPDDTPTTVEALLDRVAAEQARSQKVDVTYDSRGVPISIHADRILDAVDDEEDFTARVTPAAPGPTNT